MIVKFVITKVEDEDNWWFNSCVSCQAEVEKTDKKFKCPECKRSFGYSEKRYVGHLSLLHYYVRYMTCFFLHKPGFELLFLLMIPPWSQMLFSSIGL